MLVLKYGIECDLLQEGNVRIVDGEIEITSEDFLRGLEKKLDVEILGTFLSVNSPGERPLLVYAFSLPAEEDNYAYLDAELTVDEWSLLRSMFT